MTQMDDEFSVREGREAMRSRSRTEAEAILKLAGFEILRMWELANGYWPDDPSYDDVRQPWWLFQTDVGLIRLGWRKRVLEIDWSASEIRGVVTEDDVTKSDGMVHAWSVDKAVLYMRKQRALAETQKQPARVLE